ncbi:MAG: heavy-metal-associated domain-containing protein [Candidatus Woesearchaeota archaeon]
MEKKFSIKGMHCHSCEVLIKDSLQDLPGVANVNANQKSGFAEVVFDQSRVTEAQLKQTIRQCGFEVV